MEESAKKQVLITDDCHPLLIEGLVQLGYLVHFRPELSYQSVTELIGSYEGLVINSKILVNVGFVEKAKRLEWVARLGSGMEIIDQVCTTDRGIAVFSSPEGNCNAVAEHAMAMLLSLNRHIIRADKQVRKLDWQRELNRGIELNRKTIGIIGFGHTGSAFASKLAGWGVQVLSFDKYLQKGYASHLSFVQETDLKHLLLESDIISFHLPLKMETERYAESEIYRRCKKGVVLINTSRGQVLDTTRLLRALKTGRVGGACLDVFENEKVGSFNVDEKKMYQRLYKSDRVVLTPHIAGWTLESKQKMAEILLFKVKKWLEKAIVG
jgi:D-3-phosphoglycerate dehydrogenase / 2-oxoglutarate reductase